MFTASVEQNETAGGERGYSSADKKRFETAAVHCNSGEVSTSLVSRSELLPSQNRDSSPSSWANSPSSTTSSVEVIADEQSCDSHTNSHVSDYSVHEKVPCHQTLRSHSGAAGTNKTPMNSLNRADKTDDSINVKQTGDGMEEFAAEASGDQLSRMVQILNVPEDLRDMVELHLEYKKHGGGECQFKYDDKHQILTAVFVDAEGSANTSRFCRYL